MFKSLTGKQASKGFTLIELIVVIGIIAILAAIVIVAVNPGKQFADARDSQRWNDVNAILNATHQYAADNNGNLPASITNVATEICADGGDCTGIIDLSVLTASGTYLTSMPEDPSAATTDSTKYTIVEDAGTGRVTAAAPDAENTTVSVMR